MVKLKKEHKATVVGFGSSGLPLGQRTDLNDLAIIALKSRDTTLLNLFEELPTLEELQREKVQAQLPVIVAPEKKAQKKKEVLPPPDQPTPEQE